MKEDIAKRGVRCLCCVIDAAPQRGPAHCSPVPLPAAMPARLATPEATAARDAGLRYVSDEQPGLARRRAGKGFSYRDADGHAVRDAATLARIRALAIPPAYTEVWICALPNGHLQATGRDARRRKQYRYHPEWARVRGDGKFDRVIAFGQALPALRRRRRRDLKLPGFPQDKVLAIVVALLAETLVRVGNPEYARDNRSYGLTTLRNRHLELVKGGRARMRFRGKSGQQQEVDIDDKRLVGLIKGCQQLPGQALFQYRDDDGTLQPVDSGQVNAYLRDAMGADFSAKDFRTWGGTVAALRQFAATALPEAPSERALAALQKEVVCEVATLLGNTPAVCRKAYIDPSVFDGWRDGSLAKLAGLRGERQWEQATLKFLRSARRAVKGKAAR
ncbi:DNA topoisomerase IB [Stenotrophomonas sp. PD6]|uniref:DNA topoisomerase IB n=1 Tax=Stenotrophomonas sp. PD6 TaxID=3368612 RepID=UPI003BA0539A